MAESVVSETTRLNKDDAIRLADNVSDRIDILICEHAANLLYGHVADEHDAIILTALLAMRETDIEWHLPRIARIAKGIAKPRINPPV